MNITIKRDEKTGDGFIDLKDLEPLIDISQICFYELEEQKDNSIILKFYDKDKKLIQPLKIQKPDNN